MGLFSDLANQPDQPVQDVSNAPMTQEQFVQQNPNSSNPEYDYMLYQMQQQNDAKAQADAQLQQTDPKAYNAQKAQSLADDLFTSFTNNGHVFGDRPNMEAENTAALDAFKQIDPNAYYNAQLSLDLRKAGWDAGQGKTNDVTNARIQSNMQDALKAGFDPNQIQSLVANNYTNTAQWHAQNIADRQGQGATLQGIEKVAPAFAAMITAGALAPAAGALEAGSLAATAAPEIAGGGFYTGAGFGGEALGTAAGSALAEGAATQALPYTEAFDASNLASQGLNSAAIEQNLVGTGLNSFLSADMASLAAQGLSPAQIEATLAASYTPAELAGTGIQSLNWGATQGLSAADVLKTANQVKQGISTASTLAKLLGGSGAGGATGGATGGTKTGSATTGTATPTTGGLSQQQLAQYLSGMSSPVQAAVPGQIKMNQNPFTFDIPGQTQASQGMYDVSGVHPMANALRKA